MVHIDFSEHELTAEAEAKMAEICQKSGYDEFIDSFNELPPFADDDAELEYYSKQVDEFNDTAPAFSLCWGDIVVTLPKDMTFDIIDALKSNLQL